MADKIQCQGGCGKSTDVKMKKIDGVDTPTCSNCGWFEGARIQGIILVVMTSGAESATRRN